ncbi:MAG TPA: lysylphosphatidylglycerol synthase transmembrane domain-containing protein [Phycicoccus sp.]
MNAGTWRVVRPLAGGAILVAVLVAAGPGTVLGSFRSLDGASVAAAAVIGAMTTACAAWRWQVVAGRLGLHLRLPAAVAGCYRSQFLNATLPGGVLGDVQRGVAQGRAADAVGLGLRSVAWDRTTGFVVLAAVTVPTVVLQQVRTPPGVGPGWAIGVAALVGVLALPAARPLRRAVRRAAAVAGADVRTLAAPRAGTAVIVASVLVVAGHVATFGLAARSVGVHLEGSALVALALPVLLLGALPTNVAGWGPREGAAAWVFAEAGSGASRGVAVAVAYGVIALVATLPGAGLLALAAVRGVRGGAEHG